LNPANGPHLEVDFIAHAEYFYNTLDCNIKTVNPFTSPSKYPALMH
jgi:hypothetical protein